MANNLPRDWKPEGAEGLARMQAAIRRRVDAGNALGTCPEAESSDKLVPKTSQGRASLPTDF
jgi:hypothetical protein